MKRQASGRRPWASRSMKVKAASLTMSITRSGGRRTRWRRRPAPRRASSRCAQVQVAVAFAHEEPCARRRSTQALRSVEGTLQVAAQGGHVGGLTAGGPQMGRDPVEVLQRPLAGVLWRQGAGQWWSTGQPT